MAAEAMVLRAHYFVIAGLDPAIHAELQHENLLGLHSGKPPARHALRRHDERPHPPHLRTSRRPGRGLQQHLRREDARLLRTACHCDSGDPAREEYQTLVTQVEDRFDPLHEPRLARSLGGHHALISAAAQCRFSAWTAGSSPAVTRGGDAETYARGSPL